MMRLRYFLGVLVSGCALVTAVYLSGGSIPLGYAALDLGLVLALPLGVGLAAFGAKGLALAFGSAFSGPGAGGSRAAAAIFKWLGRATLVAMAMGFIAIQIWMMYDLESPSAIPANLAQSLQPIALGLFVALCVYRPLRYAAEAGLAATTRGAAARSDRGLGRWAAGAALAALAFVAWSLASERRLRPFLELASLSLSIFLPLGQALAGPGLSGVKDALAALRSGDLARLRSARRTFAFLAGSFAASAGLAFVLGSAYFLEGLGNRLRYGPTMALVEVGFFQSALLLLLVGLPPLAAADAALAALDSGSPGGEARA